MRAVDSITGRKGLARGRSSSLLLSLFQQEKLTVDGIFPGSMKLKAEHIESLIKKILSGETLSENLVGATLNKLRELLKHEKNVNKIKVPRGSKITVVGDTHGQISDVIHILKRQGLPSKTNMYLWNGDFVDRGYFGCEVFVLLAALKIMHPKYVYLNRGNHESEKYNICYGFYDEVLEKYHGEKIFHMFQVCFNLLPLACVLNNEVFVVHGGLTRVSRVTLKDICEFDRCCEIPDNPRFEQDMIMQDLLWSDPGHVPHGTILSPRGCGVVFGKGSTKTFLDNNNLKSIVRSHEVVDDGYDVTHDDLVYTVFSASNYCGGCVGMTMAAQDALHHEQDDDDKVGEDCMEEVSESEEEEKKHKLHNLKKKLVDYILRHHEELEHAFVLEDSGKTGTVSVNQWGKVMGGVLDVEMPWAKICPMLVTRDTPESPVKYRDFLERYSVSFHDSHDFIESTINIIYDQIHSTNDDLKEVFKRFDENHDGKISSEELEHVLSQQLPDLHLGSSQIEEIIRALDLDGDGFIEFNEFVARFSVPQSSENVVTKDWEDRIKNQLLRMLYDHKSVLIHCFQTYDEDRTGLVNVDNFVKALVTLFQVENKVKLPEDAIRQLAKGMSEYRTDGQIDYHDFLSKLQSGIDSSKCQIEKKKAQTKRNSYKTGDGFVEKVSTFELVANKLTPEELQRLKDLVRRLSHVPKLFIHRRCGFRAYGKCVSGKKLVDYLLWAHEEGVDCRKEAVRLAELLFSLGAIYHVNSNKRTSHKAFEDKKDLYTYYPAFAWDTPV
eukprot:g8386.t1